MGLIRHDLDYYERKADVEDITGSVAKSLIREIRELREELLVEQSKVQALESKVEDQSLEIDRHHKDFDAWEEMADRGAARIAENEELKRELESIKKSNESLERHWRNNVSDVKKRNMNLSASNGDLVWQLKLAREQLASAFSKVVVQDEDPQRMPNNPQVGDTDVESVLIAHQRKDISSCLCGWAELGRSHASHVHRELEKHFVLTAKEEGKKSALCEHDMTFESCGSANVGPFDLCHHDTHSCYHQWTVYGARSFISADSKNKEEGQ